MASVEGLNLRGSRYYLRVLIPEDLQASYSGRTRVNKSLGTSDRTKAVLLGLRLKAQWLEEFAFKRQQLSVMHTGSATSEDLLFRAQRSQPFSGTKHLHISPCNSVDIHPTPLPELNTQTDMQPPISRGRRMDMRDVYALWKSAQRRTKDNEQAYARSLSLAEKCLGVPLQIKSITRVHGNTFKAWLQAPEQALALRTSRIHFTNVKALLRFALLDLELIPKNPWQGLFIKVPKTVTRRPWRDEELQTLFSHPLFQRLELPSNSGRCGGLAGYWIPLIGLYTGARISELAQLRTHDIYREDGIEIIRITDTTDGQKLKTSASRRSIPIHPELIRLGLLDYVQDIRSRRSYPSRVPHSLWPDLGTSAERQGNQISSWFSSFRKKTGLTDTYPDFHCLRHTVRTKLAQARVPEHLMDAITGHETGGSTGRKVYQHTQLKDLHSAIQNLHYEVINLRRVYPFNQLSEGFA